MAHVLNPHGFGDFTVVMALSNQILGILLSFNLVSIYLVKNHEETRARQLAQAIQKALIWFFLAVTALMLVASPFLKELFNIQSMMPFFVLAAILLTSVPSVIWTGYLQGHKKLIDVGWFNFTAALLKFILAIVLAKAFGPTGGLIGVLCGGLAGLTALRFSTSLQLPDIKSALISLAQDERDFLKDIRYFIVQAILVVGGLSFLQNIDINYAKILFDPTTAGIYSGISILSNSLYFGSFLLVWILLPEISADDQTINRRLLRTAYSLLAFIALLSISVELVLRSSLTKLLLGNQFAGQGDILIFATLFQLSLVAVTLFAYYSLVMRRRAALSLGLSVIIPCICLPWLFSDTPRSMILSILASLILGVLIFSMLRYLRKGRLSALQN